MRDLLDLRPAGGFNLITADPPWRVKMWSVKGMGRSPDMPIQRLPTSDPGYSAHRARTEGNMAARHYHTMTLAEIQAIPVEAMASRDCVLLMWAIDPMIDAAIETGAAWGFKFKTVGFYWVKTRASKSRRGAEREGWDKEFPMGTGYWSRANPEQCLLFTRGHPSRASASVRRLIVAPRREHSRKPEEFYERAPQLVAGTRLDIFSRQQREGWICWGNETDRFEEGRGGPAATTLADPPRRAPETTALVSEG